MEKLFEFQEVIARGIPEELPQPRKPSADLPHAPSRPVDLSPEEQVQAISNALRYFPVDWHPVLGPEFLEELRLYGHIYMYRFMPEYPMYARAISDYPAKSQTAAGIMLMIQNNLDPAVAQYPEELITYGGNGSVFQNWAQYRLTMQYLSQMNDEQSLHVYSGHPMGLFPSSSQAPRLVVSNGMMVPNYSSVEDLNRLSAMGVTQYGQMTAGSYMYIGPQGIVHGTTITLMNAFRQLADQQVSGRIFLSSGLGGMSGAQPKAGKIVGCISVCAEVNPAAAEKRFQQGWVDLLCGDLQQLLDIVQQARKTKQVISIAYVGNVVEVWEAFDEHGIPVAVGSDQSSLHNPFLGGYYPVGMSFQEANLMMRDDPEGFKTAVQKALVRHVNAINRHAEKGTYFFDYGNAFLLEAGRAGADIWAIEEKKYRYPSYVQSILGPLCFDYGFGPFRWVCTSGDPEDLVRTDKLAARVLKELMADCFPEIAQQMQDNIHWIEQAAANQLVVGSQARILYANALGRVAIALAFNQAVAQGELRAPIILGRDHHDVSGTDSPYRETSNIYDGSSFTADMAMQNVIGDSFRGASWVSIHNGGGVGWGEAINGGFGMLIDGSDEAAERIRTMLSFDVQNGLARRAWAGNSGAKAAIEAEMRQHGNLKITTGTLAHRSWIEELIRK